MKNDLLEKINHAKTAINLVEEFLNENDLNKKQKMLYSFKKEDISSFFSELEFELMRETKDKILKQLGNDEFKIVIHQINDLNEMRIYFEDEYVGFIDLKNKEVIMFQTRERFEYVKDSWEKDQIHSLEYFKKEKERLELRQRKLFPKVKQLFSTSDSLNREFNNTIANISFLEDTLGNFPFNFQKDRIKIEKMEDFLSKMEAINFSTFGKNNLDSCQIFYLFDGEERVQYLKTLEHYKFDDLFSYWYRGEKFFLLTKKDVISHRHSTHMKHPLHIPSEFSSIFKRPESEFIYFHSDSKDGERKRDDITYLLKNKEYSTFGYGSTNHTVFRYKGFIYSLTWDGMIVSTTEGIQFLFDDIKERKIEKEEIVKKLIEDLESR